MDSLPNRDTVAAFEARLGRPLTSVLIWLLAIAIALGALSVILGALRSTFTALQPLLPGARWTDWGFRIVVIILFVGGFWIIQAKVRTLQNVLEAQSALNEGTSAETISVADLDERFSQFQKRFEYVESKVGSPLHDLLVERLMEAQEAAAEAPVLSTAGAGPTDRRREGPSQHGAATAS